MTSKRAFSSRHDTSEDLDFGGKGISLVDGRSLLESAEKRRVYQSLSGGRGNINNTIMTETSMTVSLDSLTCKEKSH